MKRLFTFIFLAFLAQATLFAQATLRGKVSDAKTNEGLLGAAVVIKGTTEGVETDFDGEYLLKTSRALPITLEVTYVGYNPQTIVVKDEKEKINILLSENASTLVEVEVKASRQSARIADSGKTVEELGEKNFIEVTSTLNDGFKEKKGVDLAQASLGYSIINTRGFNSTSPVRSLQVIDGVDNQAPGLSFSLGNFLGSSELDITKIELIAGASSAFFGPNAFNGVISMKTKNPFLSEGLAGYVKVGERNMLETAIRYAGVINNKSKAPFFAYKVNLFHFRARDWEAENYTPVSDTRSAANNPGRFDAVNIYGDEYNISGDQTTGSRAEKIGLGVFHRTGYREIDLVDYNTENYKANIAAHFRLNPSKGLESPELIYAFNFGQGTTVYQGDNRFRLKNIQFYQNKLELRKGDKYFIRAYSTRDDAGSTYDPYATALRMQEYSKPTGEWYSGYTDYWRTRIDPKAIALGYPQPKIVINPDGTIGGSFDEAAADRWLVTYRDSLLKWHQIAEIETNKAFKQGATDYKNILVPGTPEYNEVFNRIISTPANRPGTIGTKFIDKSSLTHLHGEYKIEPNFMDEITVGANFRQYTPVSEGTIFYDTAGIKITNREVGFYTGFKKKYQNGRYTLTGTMRMDKNQNFQWLPSPAASFLWNYNKKTNFRVSLSSAIRNPTLTDQYLALNVGRAILAGNIEGRKGLITIPSFIDYLNTGQSFRVKRYDIAGVKPEEVKSAEIGIHTTIGNKLIIDADAYFSIYTNFIGYNIGIGADSTNGILSRIQAYRFATNSLSRVRTGGTAIAADYLINDKYTLNANYSWNKLVKVDENDPIIPAFNTPEHKFNVGISGRDLKIAGSNNWGFRINYKWVEGYSFEGSPQFTGYIPSFGLLDGQINYRVPKINTTFKMGGTNLLRNLHYEVYGGPLIGRLVYASIIYDVNSGKR